MSDNEQTVRDFVNAWPRLDADEIVGFFAEDGVYHNMMLDPVKGQAALKGFIAGFIKTWTETHWEIVTLVAEGDTVVVERVDKTKMGVKGVDLPCVGVFEMEGGKIKVWRDYFDLPTFANAAG